MKLSLPLDQMTVAEKLQAMEALWDDLSQTPADVPTPDWHRDVLAERKQLADEGHLKWIDLDEAIADLRAGKH